MAEKKLINSFEIILSIIALLIVGYMVMQKYDVSITQKTEEVIFTDNPKSEKRYQRKTKSEEQRQREREVEEMLQRLDGRSNNDRSKYNRNSDHTTTNIQRTKDEDRFFKNMTSKYVENADDKKDIDVYAILKSSKDTYVKVRSLFSDELETPKSDTEILIEDVSFILKNKTVANSVYHEIEDLFGIPADKSADFAKKGQQAVSDWATFVEENKRKKTDNE